MGVLKRILDFFFPPRCILCGKPGKVNEDVLCLECVGLPSERLCRSFALHVQKEEHTLECCAPMRYQEPFQSTLWRFKFRNETSLAEALAKRMALALEETTTYDCVVPVPISRERMRERGYNQSALLAKAISRQTGIPYAEHLTKIKDNRIQHKLTAKEREQNVRGVYRAADCGGLRILLIDDIVTTGATVRECSRTMLRAGAVHIDCLCCAVVL